MHFLDLDRQSRPLFLVLFCRRSFKSTGYQALWYVPFIPCVTRISALSPLPVWWYGCGSAQLQRSGEAAAQGRHLRGTDWHMCSTGTLFYAPSSSWYMLHPALSQTYFQSRSLSLLWSMGFPCPLWTEFPSWMAQCCISAVCR